MIILNFKDTVINITNFTVGSVSLIFSFCILQGNVEAQIKIFQDGNTTVGTLTQFQSQTRLQILAGAGGSSDPVGLWINCLNHSNNYAYCQANNVNKPLSKALEVQLNGATKMYIKGDGGIVTISDSTLKSNIQQIDSALEKIILMRGVTYKFNDEVNNDHKLRAGFLAQNVESVIPHIIDSDSNNIKGINVIELIPYLLEAIKELNQKMDTLLNLTKPNNK